MATVKQYTAAFRTRREAIGVKFGVALRQSTKEQRVAGLTHDAVLAVVVKAIVDAGLVTNAQLDDIFDAAWAEAQIDEPAEPPPPN